MNIAIDARLLNQTGIGRYIRNLLIALSGADRKNTYSVILRGADFATIDLPGPQFKKIRLDTRWHTVSEQIRMPRILSDLKPDVVHIPYFNVPVFYRGKTVITIHDLTYLTHATGKASTLPRPVYELKRLAYRFVTGRGLEKAVRIIAVSEATKKDILRYFRVPEDRIDVIYEGVDPGILGELSKGSQKQAEQDLPYILYVGNAYPHKNLDVLISGFLSYVSSAKDSGMKLVLAGPDDYFYRRLKKLAAGFPQSDRIRFRGPVSDSELVNLYRNAGVSVFPSLAEGFGLPPLEALVCGCPVICSDIPVFHEILGDRVRYFDPKDPDALARTLLSVPDRRAKKPVHKDLLLRYSFTRMAEETLRVYEKAHSSGNISYPL